MSRDTPKEKFAELLRGHRESAASTSKTKTNLAKAIGVSQSYISVLENPTDKRSPQRHVVHAIADYFKLSFQERNQLLEAAGHERVEAPGDLHEDLLKFLRESNLKDREATILVRELKGYALRWVRQRRAREAAIKKAVLVAAGWQARLFAPENLEITILHAAEEALKADIPELIIVVAPTKAPPKFDQMRSLPLAKVRTVVQDEPLGLGHAILQARPLVGEEPFAVILPVDVDPSGDSIRKMKKIYTLHMQKPLIAVNPSRQEGKSEHHHSGVAILGEPVEKLDQLFYVKMLQEKPSIPCPQSGRTIIGRYILTPDIFSVIDATDRNPRTKKYELTDALEEFRRNHHFVCAYEVETELLSLGPVRALMDTLIRSTRETKKLEKMIAIARSALSEAEEINDETSL